MGINANDNDEGWEAPCWRSVRWGKDGRLRPWPTLPAVPRFERPPTAPVRRLKGIGLQDKRAEPMEILARLAGGTTYKTPTEGRATRSTGLTTEDISHALGYVRDPIAQRMALAMACQVTAEWPAIQALAYDVMRRDMLASPRTRELVADHRRYRVRLAMHAAFHDLVLMQRSSWRDGAKVARMRVQDYRELYEAAMGFLLTKAVAGAYVAARAMSLVI